MDPAQRPALRALQPAVWRLQGPGPQLRAEAKALLKELVAGYLGATDSTLLHFVPGQAPFVDARWQGLHLSISISYCQDLAMIALCPGARVGIDVTEIAPMPDWAAVAKSYLGPAALARLARLAPADGAARDKAFALAWAELEARGKCLGLGLQEWSAARHARLQAPAIEVITGVLDGLASGPTCAFALARNANRTQL